MTQEGLVSVNVGYGIVVVVYSRMTLGITYIGILTETNERVKGCEVLLCRVVMRE